MKKLTAILLALLLYLLLFPAEALLGAREGLLLWYRSVLPVLFPFMLLCGILMRFDLPGRLLPYIARPFHFLFGSSAYGAFAILCGFLCGFPMGAKVTRDLLSQNKISREEAWHLYGFVNNLSPSFILSFMAADQMRQPSWGGLFLLNILGSALIYGCLSARRLRRTSRRENTCQKTARRESVRQKTACPEAACRKTIHEKIASQEVPGAVRENICQKTVRQKIAPQEVSGAVQENAQARAAAPDKNSPLDLQTVFTAIDSCIYDSVENTVRLGAYIVMFSILCSAASHFIPAGHPLALPLLSCIEVTNGVHLLAGSALPLPVRYLLVNVLGAFGGLSALAQTASIAAMDRALLFHYIKSRVKITLLCALISSASVLFSRLFWL